LGGTESLVEHPWTMLKEVSPGAELEECGVTPGMIRMSSARGLGDLARDVLHA